MLLGGEVVHVDCYVVGLCNGRLKGEVIGL